MIVGFTRHAWIVAASLVVAGGLPLASAMAAGEWPDACEESTLATDGPTDQLILVCLPARFNGTLLVYAHGYVPPQEPLALPEELGEADVAEVVDRLLLLGFGVAASSYHKNGYALEAAESDLNDLVDHVRATEPRVETVYVIGASEGGLITTMLVEKYPETFAGGLALCGPLAGVPYQIDYLADVRVLFDYFYPDVFPFGLLDVPDEAHEQWEEFRTEIAAAVGAEPDGIAQLFDVARVPCAAVTTSCAQDILAYSLFETNDLLDTAGGWPVSNAAKLYRRSKDDAALNAGVERFDADPDAAAYTRRYYRPHGRLRQPLVTLHTTQDPVVPHRHETAYFRRVALSGRSDQLTVLSVERAGHCAFTAAEVIGGLAALLLKAGSELSPPLVDSLETLRGVVDVGPGADRLAERMQDQTREFLDRLRAADGFLEGVGDGPASR